MNFSPFLETVPSWLRLLLAVGLTVGFSLLAVRLTHHRAIRLAQADKLSSRAVSDWESDSEEPMPAPSSWELGGKVTGLTQAAFVFLLAFTLSNFWSNSQDARTAVMQENMDYSRAVLLARDLSPAQASSTVQEALDAYHRSVVSAQVDAMQSGSSESARDAFGLAVTELAEAAQRAGKEGAASAPEWSSFTSTLEDMTQQGTTRIAQVPGPSAPSIVAMILFLGLANLTFVIALLPTRRRANYALAGVLAAVTGVLFFILVEASNPYVGGPAVHIPFPLG